MTGPDPKAEMTSAINRISLALGFFEDQTHDGQRRRNAEQVRYIALDRPPLLDPGATGSLGERKP